MGGCIMQNQDITFTIDLEEMTPDKYKKIMDFVEEAGISQVETFTYDPEDPTREIDLTPLYQPKP